MERDWVEEMTDEWRMVEGYEGKYWINPFGLIRNQHGKILSPIDLGGGVKAIDLYGEGLRERYLVKALLVENYPELFEEKKNDR